MATLNITSDAYLDELIYADGDYLYFTDDVTLTIRKSNTVKPYYINASKGRLIIDPTVPGGVAPLVFELNHASTSGITVSNVGDFQLNGGWHTLGTGTGAAGQTITFYTPHYCPWVQVETFAGSGVYLDYKLINDMTLIGGNEYLGLYYTQVGDTITFGDGVNGYPPPSGSNIRCPDVTICSDSVDGESVVNNRNQFSISSGATGSITNALFSSGVKFTPSQATSLYLDNIGVFGPGYLSQIASLTATKVVTCAYWGTTLHGFQVQKCEGAVFGTLDADSYLTYGIDLTYCNDFTADRIRSSELNRNSTYDTGFRMSSCNGAVVNEAESIGHKVSLSTVSNITIKKHRHSDTANGIYSTLYAATAMISLDGCTETLIEDSALLPGGTHTYGALFYFSLCTNCYVVGFNFPNCAADIKYIAGFVNVSKNCTVARGYAEGGTYSYSYIFSADCYGMKVLDVLTDTGKSESFDTNLTVVEGATIADISYSQGAVKDTNYAVTYDDGASPTTGNLVVLPCAQNQLSYFTVLSGNPRPNNSSEISLYTIGDSCSIEIPNTLKGITGFQNIDPTKSGYYYDAQYAINTGSGYSAWKDLTGANLSAEVVDSTVGFNIKFKVTSTSTSTSARFNRFEIPITIDNTYQRPYLEVPVTITASASLVGAEVRIYDDSGINGIGKDLSGIESNTSSSYLFNSSPNQDIWIQIMLNGYEEFLTKITVGTTSKEFYALLTADTNI